MESDTFLIGEVEPHVARLLGGQGVVTFPTLREFDQWRYHSRFSNAPATIEPDVTAALRELGCPRTDIRGAVRDAIEALCERRSVGTVGQLRVPGVSERTFIRHWNALISETPKRFLARVRLLHARRLVEQGGLSAKEAAYRAGYASTWHMGRALRSRAERNAHKE